MNGQILSNNKRQFITKTEFDFYQRLEAKLLGQQQMEWDDFLSRFYKREGKIMFKDEQVHTTEIKVD